MYMDQEVHDSEDKQISTLICNKLVQNNNSMKYCF